MQYQKIKVEAVQGKKASEPLLYSVSSDDKGASGVVEALKVVDWSKVFPNMRPNDVGHIQISSYYEDNRL